MTDHDGLIRQMGDAEDTKMEQDSRRASDVAMVRRTNRRTRRVALVAFASGLLFISGVALAEWLATGTGSGYAKAANAENLTTNVTVASESLYPGGTGDLALTVNNPNPFPVTVTAVV